MEQQHRLEWWSFWKFHFLAVVNKFNKRLNFRLILECFHFVIHLSPFVSICSFMINYRSNCLLTVQTNRVSVPLSKLPFVSAKNGCWQNKPSVKTLRIVTAWKNNHSYLSGRVSNKNINMKPSVWPNDLDKKSMSFTNIFPKMEHNLVFTLFSCIRKHVLVKTLWE